MMRSASDVSVSNDAPEMVMIRLGMMKLLDNSLSAPEYSVLQAILSITRDLSSDVYSRLINWWALVLLVGVLFR